MVKILLIISQKPTFIEAGPGIIIKLTRGLWPKKEEIKDE